MITLATTAWEGNIDQILNNSWFLNYKNPLVKEKLLVVNNLQSLDKLKGFDSSIRVVYVNKINSFIKSYFRLDINENTIGYYYTIPIFAQILSAYESYIFSFNADCVPEFEDDFLTDSIEQLDNRNILTTTLPIKGDLIIAQKEACDGSDKFFQAKTFCEQLFIGKSDTLRAIDYNTDFPGDFTPGYGGNSFEKRVAMYMNNTDKYRAIYKKYKYTHETTRK